MARIVGCGMDRGNSDAYGGNSSASRTESLQTTEWAVDMSRVPCSRVPHQRITRSSLNYQWSYPRCCEDVPKTVNAMSSRCSIGLLVADLWSTTVVC